MMRRHNIYRLLSAVWLAAVVWTLGGCSHETRLPGGEGHGATFTISTRAVDPGADALDPDNKIATLRVMSFRRSGGALRTNERYTVALHGEITHTIPTGLYDFVFIANEPASLTARLDGVTNRGALNSIAIPEACFTSEELIPQLQEVKNVEVRVDGDEAGVRIGGGPLITAWALELVRMAARIDVTLTSEVDMEDDFAGVRLSNVPNAVALFPGEYSGAEIARDVQREFLLTETPSRHFAPVETLPEGIAWAMEVVRLIVPANEFDDIENRDKAMVMTLLMGDRYNPRATMGADTEALGHSLPRNTWLKCDGEISTPFLLDLDARDWTEAIASGDIKPARMLNVSEIAPGFVLGVTGDELTVAFWSNQPAVELEEGAWSGYYNAYLNYNASTGIGSVVFTLKGERPDVDQRIYLRAGKASGIEGWLRREITLRAN